MCGLGRVSERYKKLAGLEGEWERKEEEEGEGWGGGDDQEAEAEAQNEEEENERKKEEEYRVPSGLPIKCGGFSLKMWEFNIALNPI